MKRIFTSLMILPTLFTLGSYAQPANTFYQVLLDSSLKNTPVIVDTIKFSTDSYPYANHVVCNYSNHGPVTSPATISGMDVLQIYCQANTPGGLHNGELRTLHNSMEIYANNKKATYEGDFYFDPWDARGYGVYRKIILLYLNEGGQLAYRLL